MAELTKLEEIVLIAIWNLRDDAYGVNIKKKVHELAGKEYFYNTLYTTFDQLLRKDLIRKGFGEPTAVRGGKRKVYFRLTLDGNRALREAYEKQRRLWAGFAVETFREESA